MHCTFVPPYLLERLAATEANPVLSGRGRSTLQVDARLRDRRAEAACRVRATLVSSDPAERVIHAADYRRCAGCCCGRT